MNFLLVFHQSQNKQDTDILFALSELFLTTRFFLMFYRT